MSSIESLWIYVAVPAALITTLVLIKLRLQKAEKMIDKMPFPEDKDEIAQSLPPSNKRDSIKEKSNKTTQSIARTPVRPEPPTDTEASDDEKPADCPHYMGFLYMRKGPENAHIPTECYQCRKLLRCLYSPRIMEKVYGNES